MAELKSKKSFGQAFREAEKQGLKKFQWNGGWYTTEKAENKKAQTRTTTAKGDYKEKTNKKDGTRSNRYTVKNNKNGYYVFDNEVQRVIGSLFKDKQAVVNYMKSDDFKNDAGEPVATAARTKLNRKTSGFQPVDENKNYNDKQGNTRLYQERGTGRYLVTDNYGNIVGYSFDPAAATSDANWGGWIAYTGSKDDIKAAEAGKMRDLANRNEEAQKSRQARDRKVNEWDSQIQGLNRLAAGTNFTTSILNMPNHIVTGAVRTINPWSDYTAQDYLHGFNLAKSFEGLDQSVGLGDVVGDMWTTMPVALKEGMNVINPTSVASLTSSYKGSQSGVAARSTVNGQTVRTNIGPQITMTQGASPANKGFFSRLVSRIKTRPFGAKGKPHKTVELTSAPPQETGMVVTHNNTGSNNWFNMKAIKASPFHSGTPGQATGSRFVAFEPWSVSGQAGNTMLINDSNLALSTPRANYVEDIPVANFWYSGEGNPNTYAQGRIATGEVVPGTSGENWSGGQSGGTVVVDNTKGHVSPAFGGITVGGGRDNQSSWYLPLAYKKGGKAKLISKKSCRK